MTLNVFFEVSGIVIIEVVELERFGGRL